MKWAIISVVVIIIGLFIYYGIKDKRKLESMERKLDRKWKAIYKLIMLRFNAAIEAKPKDKKLIELFDKFNNYEFKDIEDIIVAYYELNHYLEDITLTLKYKKIFNTNKEEIDKAKLSYNNDALKMTNQVKMIPLNIYAKLFGYKKWVYFRNEE